MTVEEAAAKVPDDTARYHVFNFAHNHEGDNLESVIFIYSCPGYKLAVKERMLYASCKAPLLDQIEQEVGITVAKKLEIDDGSEFTQQEFYTAL